MTVMPKPITDYLTDPTIAALCERYGPNFGYVRLSRRLHLISALALNEWPKDVPDWVDAHQIWMELQYLDRTARIALIRGIAAGLM
jgi:hypothetical protein